MILYFIIQVKRVKLVIFN